MNKFYVLIVVMIFSTAQGFSQTFTWTGGGDDSKWTTTGNWSGGTGYPSSNLHNVIFNSSPTVNLDASVTVKSISLTGSGNTVVIDGGVGINTIDVASSDANAPTFTIDANNTLDLVRMEIHMANNIQGTVNGKLILEGTSDDDYTIFGLPIPGGQSAILNVNGIIEDKYGKCIDNTIDGYLSFNNGSKLLFSGPEVSVPIADYNTGSEVAIEGTTNKHVSILERDGLSTLTYNSSLQSAEVQLNIPGHIVINTLNISNTNNQTLVLISNGTVDVGVQTNFDFTVNNFNISGNSNVALSKSSLSSRVYFATVNNNFTMSGNSFSIQNANDVTNTTTLYVKGNIIHNSGAITATSTATATAVSLFNIEMNGTSAQQITSSSARAFNNDDNQVALVISNPAGVTLGMPLDVGMIGFKSNGKLNTTDANYLTIKNPSTAAYVVSGAGFVDGPVRRATNSTSEYIFPTGNGTTQRYVSVYPNSTTLTTYQGSYSNTNSNLVVHPALTAVVGYNWEVDRIGSGASAQIELTLPGPIAGAGSGDVIVVAKSSDESAWQPVPFPGSFVLGSSAAQGNKIKSEVQTSFSSFTIAWGPMSATLPINLLSFTATKSAKTAKLNWKVTGNSTPAAFDVMKSSDGANFSKIGTLTGMEGKLSYDFTDNNLTAGNNYYRLKMLDKDGAVSYSNIIVVMNGSEGTIINSMMPTMVVDRARLSISSSAKGNMQLVITDINGRIVQTQVTQINQGNQEVWINAARLSTGFFQVTGYINGEKTTTIRFFKR